MEFPPYIALRGLAGSYSMRAVGKTTSTEASVARAMIVPMAVGQFIASYATTNMNVAIGTIATDFDTNVWVCRRP